jgi:hypothetical protein
MIEDMSPLTVAAVGHGDQEKATEILRRYRDQDLTMTDAVGLHVMAARRIPLCWSTDFHVGLTGIPLVINQP